MSDSTDIIIFIGGVFVTFIFGFGAFLWTRVTFSNAMKRNVDSE